MSNYFYKTSTPPALVAIDAWDVKRAGLATRYASADDRHGWIYRPTELKR